MLSWYWFTMWWCASGYRHVNNTNFLRSSVNTSSYLSKARLFFSLVYLRCIAGDLCCLKNINEWKKYRHPFVFFTGNYPHFKFLAFCWKSDWDSHRVSLWYVRNCLKMRDSQNMRVVSIENRASADIETRIHLFVPLLLNQLFYIKSYKDEINTANKLTGEHKNKPNNNLHKEERKNKYNTWLTFLHMENGGKYKIDKNILSYNHSFLLPTWRAVQTWRRYLRATFK